MSTTFDCASFCNDLKSQIELSCPGAQCNVSSEDECWAIRIQGDRAVFLVGYWLYVPVAGVEFDPECADTFQYSQPCNMPIDDIVRLINQADPFPRKVLMRIKALHPELEHAVEYCGKEILFMGERIPGNLNMWIDYKGYGWKIGVRGCKGKNCYVVGDKLYVSSSDDFVPCASDAYELCKRNEDEIVKKLHSMSVNWLSKTAACRNKVAPPPRAHNSAFPRVPACTQDGWSTVPRAQKSAPPRVPACTQDGWSTVAQRR